MRINPAQPVVPAAKIEHYKALIAKIKNPRNYTDRVLLNIYKQLVDEYEKQLN